MLLEFISVVVILASCFSNEHAHADMLEKTIGLLPWIRSQLYYVGVHGIKELNKLFSN